MAKDSELVRRYDEARELVRKRENRELSAKEFLDTVAPGNRTKKSARDYIRRIRSGERTGTKLETRAKRDSGRTVRVDFEVEPGDIRSQNVIIPLGKSRFDLYSDDIRATIDRGLRQSYNRRRQAPSPRPDEPRYEALPRLPIDATITNVHSVRRPKRPAVVLREAS